MKDRLLRELRGDLRAGRAALEAGRDHGLAERLQGARDVDALAPGERAALDGAVAAPEPEARHGQRLVDRGVECDGDDHCSTSGASRGTRLRMTGRLHPTSSALTAAPPMIQ